MTSPRPSRLRPGESLARFSDEEGIPCSDLPSEGTLAKYRCIGGGPPYIKPKPSVVLYDYEAFREWMKSRMTPKASTAADAVSRRQSAREPRR